MAVDYCLTLDCEAKRHFGNGDHLAGSADILERLKSRNRANAIARIAQDRGQDPSEMKVTLRVPGRDGQPIEKEVSIADLQAEGAPLEEHASRCAGCPANFLAKPFGCFGVVNYPVPAAAENWLMGRLQPMGTVGAELCLRFMADFGLTGETVHQMRESGFFENTKGLKVTFKTGFLKSVSITSDQLLESVLAAGEQLNPDHCYGVLLWLGAIKVDGMVPADLKDLGLVQKLSSLRTLEEKEHCAHLEIGPSSPADTDPFRNLLKAMYLSWLLDVPLLVSV